MLRIQKRPWLWLPLFCLGIALAAYLLGIGQRRICQANLRRIKVGMNRAEVEALLGKPQVKHYLPANRDPSSLLFDDGSLFYHVEGFLPADREADVLFYRDDGFFSEGEDLIMVVLRGDGRVDEYWISPGGKRTVGDRLRDRFAEWRAWLGW